MAERGSALLATALLLTGGRAAGEDLLQSALERLRRHWHRLEGDPEAYLRRTLYHLAIDRWRWWRRRPEVPLEVEPPCRPDGTETVQPRHELMQALASLPPKTHVVEFSDYGLLVVVERPENATELPRVTPR